jgi:hypothetical protein
MASFDIGLSFCADAAGRITGTFTCAPEATCGLPEAPLVGTLVDGALQVEAQVPDLSSCAFDGRQSGATLQGDYRCQRCTIVTCKPGQSGTWNATRCP